MKQFSTDVIKEDQPRVEKSIPDLTLTQKDTRKGEKLIADGLRPGDRLTVSHIVLLVCLLLVLVLVLTFLFC